MKLGELGFRNIYHKFFAVNMDRTLRQLAQKCDGSLNATHIVLYGYIDSVAGLMFEILGVCNKDKNEFYNAYTGSRMSIRAAELWNYEASAFDSNLDRIEGLYYDRIDDVSSDDGRNGVEQTRLMVELDSKRTNFFPDRVTAFVKTSAGEEEVLIDITSFDGAKLEGKDLIKGILRENLKTSTALKKGDEVQFFCESEGRLIAMPVPKKNEIVESIEDLINVVADKADLKSVIAHYLDLCDQGKESDESLSVVLAELKKSKLYVPEILLKKNLDIDNEEVPLLADTDSNEVYFPVLSSEEENDPDANYKLKCLSFDEVYDIVNNFSAHKVDGIVVNPFSERYFMLVKAGMDIVKGMK